MNNKINNKGFAITGIIYTLFIVFLLVLLSVLSGLSIYRNLMINSTESLEQSFEGIKIETGLEEIQANDIAPYFGKYIFQNSNTNTECTVYLTKNQKISEAVLTPETCNKEHIKLTAIYSFEGE